MGNRDAGRRLRILAVSRSLRLASHPRALIDRYTGREDFEFPGSADILDLVPSLPDLIHCHNLHGGYFDLRALASLSHRVPIVVTLHDAWLLSGHCAHSFDCDRWQTGCGECPDLAIPPAIRRDATADNWIRKRDIFAQSRLYIAAPSAWLLQKVARSMLAPAVRQAMVIPNGVDLTVFSPADRKAARARLGIAPDVPVVLFTTGPRTDPWRDVALLQSAIPSIALRMSGTSPLFLGIGADAPADDVTGVNVELRTNQSDPKTMADYYRAADVYLHAARADTFPGTVLEALACGTPVAATDVGGIPEQVRNGSTGTLIPAGDSGAMADAVVGLLTNADARRTISENAARDARDRFDVNLQIERYLAWYRTILDDFRGIPLQV